MTECPYDQLYIYELEGSLEPVKPNPEDGFLGCWHEGDSAFLFFNRSCRDKAEKLAGNLSIREEYQMSYADWQGDSVFKNMRIGKLNIRPPWVKSECIHNEMELLMDPGMVFGAGNHPTTRHCLSALSTIERRGQFPKTVTDLGCGTGILALASIKYGAKKALAVDLNPLCHQVTEKNVKLNNFEEYIEVISGNALDYADYQSDLLMANLEADFLKKLAEKGGFENREYIVLSGITRSKAAQIRELGISSGRKLIEQWVSQSTWFTYLFG